MSNFICSECGITNIDCGSAGYKTPKEIELEEQKEILIKFILRHHPEMEEWLQMNFKKEVERTKND